MSWQSCLLVKLLGTLRFLLNEALPLPSKNLVCIFGMISAAIETLSSLSRSTQHEEDLTIGMSSQGAGRSTMLEAKMSYYSSNSIPTKSDSQMLRTRCVPIPMLAASQILFKQPAGSFEQLTGSERFLDDWKWSQSSRAKCSSHGFGFGRRGGDVQMIDGESPVGSKDSQ